MNWVVKQNQKGVCGYSGCFKVITFWKVANTGTEVGYCAEHFEQSLRFDKVKLNGKDNL